MKIKTTFYIIALILVVAHLTFASSDTCNNQKELAKSIASHDLEADKWYFRSLFIGIPLPLVGPIGAGIVASTQEVEYKSTDSLFQDSCFHHSYQQAISYQRAKNIVKGGAIGTALGCTLYFLIIVAVVGISASMAPHIYLFN